jgi:homoserine O-acetyltransferase
MLKALVLAGIALADPALLAPHAGRLLLNPEAAEVNAKAPTAFRIRLETTKGVVVVEVRREWAPLGVDRFFNLVRAGYYDDMRLTRIVAPKWAQFGIHGDPKVAQAWRDRKIADDPRVLSNERGTIAFAYAVPNGRTTQVFINLRDNTQTHDREPFVPFGRVIAGMDVVDSWYSGYGEDSGGGIRGGRQTRLFESGNRFLDYAFPQLDSIRRAFVLESANGPR